VASVGVALGVSVEVAEGVGLEVGVGVGLEVDVGTGVEVGVGLDEAVDEGVAAKAAFVSLAPETDVTNPQTRHTARPITLTLVPVCIYSNRHRPMSRPCLNRTLLYAYTIAQR
jgi:hypothetical protein